jgi:hypothetical protein
MFTERDSGLVSPALKTEPRHGYLRMQNGIGHVLYLDTVAGQDRPMLEQMEKCIV